MILKPAFCLGGACVALLALALASACIGATDGADRFRAEPSVDGKSIVVRDASTGGVVHTIAKPPGVIRSTFALDNGTIVATTTRGATEFWNAADGTLSKRLNERVHSVGNAGNRVLAFNDERALLVRSYPDLGLVSTLESNSEWGPSEAAFSADDRYVAVQFCNHYPLSDEQFLNPEFDATLYVVRVYEVRTGERMPDVSGFKIGRFSDDNRRYVTSDGRQFDLKARSWVSPKSEGGSR